MAKVTIEGTVDQIAAEVGATGTKPRARRGESATAKRNAQIVIEQGVIRRAFFLIRHVPTHKLLAERFARRLGGSAPRSEELLQAARHIIAQYTAGELASKEER